uniref:Immunoglobulin domain-containing protein n=1 Tax=Kryptolebias marmoratus TaxID=37003 RepID=A0A3Q2ZQK2_KRYMA
LHLSVCVSAALVAMAAELVQDEGTLTRTAGDTVSFSCGGTDQCGSYVFWYQKTEIETFRLILYVYGSGCSTQKGYNHPQEKDFSAEKTQKGCELKIDQVKVDHSASYYCGFSTWTDTLSFFR